MTTLAAGKLAGAWRDGWSIAIGSDSDVTLAETDASCHICGLFSLSMTTKEMCGADSSDAV